MAEGAVPKQIARGTWRKIRREDTVRQVSLGRRERQDGAAPIRHSDKRIVHHVDHKQKIVADRKLQNSRRFGVGTISPWCDICVTTAAMSASTKYSEAGNVA